MNAGFAASSFRNRICFLVVALVPGAAFAGPVRMVALSGQTAPGTPSGVNYSGFDTPLLSSAGQIAFAAILTGSGITSANNTGIWSEGSGSLALVAREGSQAPGTPSGVRYGGFNTLTTTALNSAGQTAFLAFLNGSGITSENNSGIWSEGSGSLALVAREGSQAPGTPSGVFLGVFDSPMLNSAGQVAFVASLTGSGVNFSNDRGIWSDRSGSLALVAREGSQAPGMPIGVNHNSFNTTVVNSAGKIAFAGSVTGSGITSANNTGIWSEGSGSLALVAREGSQAAGTPSGVNYGTLNTTELNSAGQVAFAASLTGSGVDSTNDSGIWSEGSGSLALVAREGSQAPGTPSGVNFGRFDVLTTTALNSAGQIAFIGELSGSGIDGTNAVGIWATDPDDSLKLIARTGDLLEVAPADFRTISSIDFVGGAENEDGRPSGLNELGQIAFYAAFTDGSSGVFVSNLVAIPEPTSLLLTMLAVGWISLRRRCADNR